MWIKEIILDGFKSYASRTVINGFDSQFNAITGLNGSGKSNILDAILFCLGLSKEYDILRIRKLQELIYKNGTAGITKAEVSLIFDNSDQENSPSGYQDCKELVVTRQITTDNKSKYFINGHGVTQKDFKNMFRSVQLNIDNPHFLVAQGRITKIINLKPQELIGMLEETAGTSLYNEKKREAQRTIEKKEEKLRQVQDLIETEIRPQMDKLVREKNMFLVWRTQETEKNRLRQQVHSYEYYKKFQSIAQKAEETSTLLDQQSESKQTLVSQQDNIRRLEQEIASLIKGTSIREYEEAEKNLKKLTHVCLRLEKEYDQAKKSKERSESERQALEQALKQLQSEVERFEQKRDIVSKTLEQMKSELQEKKDFFEEQQRQARTGENNEDAKLVIQQDVRDTEKYVNQFKSTQTQLKTKVQRIDEELDASKKFVENAQKESTNITTKLSILKNDMEMTEKELEGGQQLENDLSNLKNKKHESDGYLHELNSRLHSVPQNLLLDLSRLIHWDKRRVYGKVFELFELKEEGYARAIEQGAGPKLGNVIVDDEETSTYMLSANIVGTLTYYIPNSKVSTFYPNDEITKAAEQIAHAKNGFAKSGLHMISYNKQVERAMGYVFGNFFVASSMEIAQAIAYHPSNKQKFKVVTKDGDVVDPSGTITGGYINDKNQILPRVKEILQMKSQIRVEEEKNQKLIKEIKQKEDDSKYHQQLRQQLQDKKYQYDSLNQKQQRSSNQQLQSDQQSMETEKADLLESIRQLDYKIQDYEDKLKNLQSAQKQALQGKSAKQLLKEQCERTAKEIEKLKNQVTKYKQDYQAIDVEQESCKQEIIKSRKRMNEEDEYLSDQSMAAKELQQQLETHQGQLNHWQDIKQKLERENQQQDQTSKRLQEQLDEQKRYLDQLTLELQRLDMELSKNKKDTHELRQDLNNLENKHEFIRQDKEALQQKVLNDQHSYIYQFEYELTKDRLNRLEHDQNRLSKQVNFKVEAMTEQVEKEFSSLEEKRKILLTDKSMLCQNMVELDDKKSITLEKCFHEVNKHFGQIFSSLLPGAQAKIARIEDKLIDDGLELTVAFNNKWKSSLSELSGGQRSLLALSFILALLKYKPAPFYILDEVDSALDLSHTENIGHILSQNFKQSQFILISLKDGMYQNANVLFKVQFIDGVSKCDRYALKDKKTIAQQKKNKKMVTE